jgi:hypothetical protein
MSEIALSYEASPGAIGANLACIFVQLTGIPAYVGNDGVVHEFAIAGVSNVAITSNRNIFTKAQVVTPSNTLANTGNTTVDANLSDSFTVIGGQLTANIGIPNPANLSDGQGLAFLLKQGTAGNFTVTYGSQFKFANANEKVLTATANAVDIVTGKYFATANIIVCGARQNLV